MDSRNQGVGDESRSIPFRSRQGGGSVRVTSGNRRSKDNPLNPPGLGVSVVVSGIEQATASRKRPTVSPEGVAAVDLSARGVESQGSCGGASLSGLNPGVVGIGGLG